MYVSASATKPNMVAGSWLRGICWYRGSREWKESTCTKKAKVASSAAWAGYKWRLMMPGTNHMHR